MLEGAFKCHLKQTMIIKMTETVSTEVLSFGVIKTIIRMDGIIHCATGPAVTITRDGSVICRKWYRNGVKHRDNGPAVVSNRKGRYKRAWYANGAIHRKKLPARIIVRAHEYIKEWYTDGMLHRVGAPARIMTTDGIIAERVWCCRGKIHNVGAPAIVRYSLHGNVKEEIWMENDQIHRDDKYAILTRNYLDGTVSFTWYQLGLKHRENNPAVIIYNNAGVVVGYRWYSYGKLHRVGAPASIDIYNGNEKSARAESWYIDGVQHRDGGLPAVTRCKYGTVIGQEWYQHGKQNAPGLISWYTFCNEYHEIHREEDGSHYMLTHAKFSGNKSVDILKYYPPRGEFNHHDYHQEIYSVWYTDGQITKIVDTRSKWPWIYDILPQPIAEEIEPHLIILRAYLHKK